jgi:hypothetical protein
LNAELVTGDEPSLAIQPKVNREAFGFRSTLSSGAFQSVCLPYGLAVVWVAIALVIKLALLHFDFANALSVSSLAAIAITFW